MERREANDMMFQAVHLCHGMKASRPIWQAGNAAEERRGWTCGLRRAVGKNRKAPGRASPWLPHFAVTGVTGDFGEEEGTW